MTIKDIEGMRSRIQSNMTFYLEEETSDGKTVELYYKNFDNLLKYVKQNYNDNLTHKNISGKKILNVKIWRH